MEKTYTINIENGIGLKRVANGTYDVTANVNGYDNETITPKIIDVNGDQEFFLTISASGTLTLHVTEEGTEEGTPVVGAMFYRTDSNGTTYGDPVVTDTNGNAVFNNVPFAMEDAPAVYFKQVSNLDEYTINEEVMEVFLTEQETTLEITNSRLRPITFHLTDEFYENLPINDGTITLS